MNVPVQQQQQQGRQDVRYAIDRELLDGIAAYLGNQSYNDVSRFINKLGQQEVLNITAIEAQLAALQDEVGKLTNELEDRNTEIQELKQVEKDAVKGPVPAKKASK